MSQYKKHLQSLYSNATFRRKLEYIDYNFGQRLKSVVKSGQSVLEIGPGMGELVGYLNNLGLKQIDVVDNDKHILDEIRKNFKIRREFLNGNITVLDSKLANYWTIIGIQVLEHMSVFFLPKIVAVLYKHLDRGGEMIFVVPNAGNPLGMVERYGDWQHTTAFTEQSLRDLVVASGIKNYEVTLSGYLIPPSNLVNVTRIVAQKILHLFLLGIMIINGGTFFKILNPNIVLRVKKLR